jgi:3-phenylpropionate/cinnamic acid dioxygenase small subunit
MGQRYQSWVAPVSEDAENVEAIRRLVAQSARRLDSGQFSDYIDLFADDGSYVLQADSTEIGSTMIWLDLSRVELSALLKESPQHVHDLAGRTHMVTVDDVQINGDVATALSTFVVFRTDVSGNSNVYAVGYYEDQLRQNSDQWRIVNRRVLSKTRMFRTPTPMPL